MPDDGDPLRSISLIRQEFRLFTTVIGVPDDAILGTYDGSDFTSFDAGKSKNSEGEYNSSMMMLMAIRRLSGPNDLTAVSTCSR